MSSPAGPAGRQAPIAVLVATFLFNLGQGVLRPALPLYLQQFFAANYRMVTLIPVVFGAGKWLASLPTGFLLDRVGRKRLMMVGLLLMAAIDFASALTPVYSGFLALRGLGGVGWAMFGTVAIITVVAQPGAQRRGRALSFLLIAETLGLLLGSTTGGLLYKTVGIASPFIFEAGCMIIAAVAVTWYATPAVARRAVSPYAWTDRTLLRGVLAIPGVWIMSVTSGVLIAIQTGIIVFLYPLYLAERAHLGAEAVGYFISLTVVGRLLALWAGGRFSDKWGRMTVIIPGLLGYAVLLGSLGFVTRPAVLALWSVLLGAAAGFVATIPAAVIGDQVPAPHQGIAIGWLRTVTDSGMIVGPLVFGALADAMDLVAPFIFASALLVLTAWRAHRSVKLDGCSAEVI